MEMAGLLLSLCILLGCHSIRGCCCVLLLFCLLLFFLGGGGNIKYKATFIYSWSSGAYCIKLLPEKKTLVKSENSDKHEFTIEFTIGRQFRLK